MFMPQLEEAPEAGAMLRSSQSEITALPSSPTHAAPPVPVVLPTLVPPPLPVVTAVVVAVVVVAVVVAVVVVVDSPPAPAPVLVGDDVITQPDRRPIATEA